MDGLPGLLGAAFDARGNGAYLAEYAMQRYGSGRVQQVMPTEGWYREHMPPVKAALEDGNLVDLPKDEDTLDDLRAVQVVNGVPAYRSNAQKQRLTVVNATGIQPSHWRWRISPAVKLTKGR